MKKSAHGNPILIQDNSSTVIHRVSPYLEKDIQDLIFKNPNCLPISDIDESFNPIISVCKELNTDAGPLDILMMTPNGDIAVVETKMWNNPESRRKVVAQILDYAKEISKWTYSDLQREVNRNLGTKGNHLFEVVLKNSPEITLNETDFVDAVSRNLRTGKFMLIIAGDGIREGAKNLTDFINKSGNLNFNLAMIELPIFNLPSGGNIIFPRTVVKTVDIEKIQIEIPEGLMLISKSEKAINKPSESNKALDADSKREKEFLTDFWKEFVHQLEFDDPEQPMPKPYKMKNLFINPGGLNDEGNWISCYFMASKKRVGVYFRFRNNSKGEYQKEQLHEHKDDIKTELGSKVIWEWDTGRSDGFHIRIDVDDVYSDNNRAIITKFFNEWTNKFVNVIRPKLKKIQ